MADVVLVLQATVRRRDAASKRPGKDSQRVGRKTRDASALW